MKKYVALLRGINVGGRNALRMKQLRALLGDLGLDEVRTYIQSGNVVFESGEVDPPRLASRIGAEIEERHGFEPRVMVMKLETMERAIDANPFAEAESEPKSEPKSLHVYFLASEPEDPDLDTLDRLAKESERYVLRGDVLYLHAPDGIGRSKLVAWAERALGVAMTGRNWRTATRIMAMADDG